MRAGKPVDNAAEEKRLGELRDGKRDIAERQRDGEPAFFAQSREDEGHEAMETHLGFRPGATALLLGQGAGKIIAMVFQIMSRRTFGWIGAGCVALLALYAALAYALEPELWRHYEHQHALSDFGAVTQTKLGIPGDALNVGLEGSKEDVLCAMNAAGWTPADPVTLKSSVEIAGSVLLRPPYAHAPVSHLFYHGRRQDLAFEKPSGKSP